MQIVRSQNNDDSQVETDIYELKTKDHNENQTNHDRFLDPDNLENRFKNLNIDNNLKSMVIDDKIICSGCQKVVASTKMSESGIV